MKNILMMAACIIALSCNKNALPSKTPYINSTIKNENGDTILAGHCSISIMQQEPYKTWFDKSYNSYTTDTSTLKQLQPLLKPISIEIFLGSWCGDSKREVPRMLKLLNDTSFDTTNVRLIFVDNSSATYKQSPQHEEKGKNIFRVPTFILYKNNKEIGRIVETAFESLEKDLLTILNHKTYTPKYNAVNHWQQNIKGNNKIMSVDQLQAATQKIKPLCSGMGTFNSYGYVLLAQKNFTEAMNVFKLNTLLYPEKSGVFDSLGEAYFITGNKAEARSNYEKALALEPGNEHIIKMLKQLE